MHRFGIAAVAAAVAVAGAGAIGVAAQQTPAPVPAPLFRTSVTLVPVDVTVLDASGQPVSGLTAEDFEIKLNGASRPVRTLTYVAAPAASAAPLSATADAAMPARLSVRNADPGDTRVIVVAVDDLSVSPAGGKRTLAAARRFVADRPAGELIGLATTSGRVTVNPTGDHAAVAAALARVVGEFDDPRRAVAPGGPTVGLAEAAEIVDFNNQAVQDEVLTRECGEAGRTGGSGDALYAVAISAFNAKCAQDTLSAARLIASSMRATTSQQVSALVAMLDAMRGASGLKQLVLVSGGVGVARTALTSLQPVARAAAEAGVRISVLMEDEPDLDMAGTVHGATEVGSQVRLDTGTSNRRRADNLALRSTLQTLADMTGGTFETVVTNGEGAFARAERAASAVYRLGVELPPEAVNGKPLRVAASVKGRALVVRANHEAVVSASQRLPPPADRDTALRSAMQQGRAYFDVPVELGVVRRRGANGVIELGIGVRVPADVDGPVTIAFGTVDGRGMLTEGRRTIAAPAGGDFRLIAPMPVTAGPYHVRCAVSDARGQVGSVDAAIDATLTPMGSWQASDVLTWRVAGGQAELLPGEQLPAGLDELGAGLELYAPLDAPPPSGVQVALSLTAEAAKAPAVSRTVTPRVAATFLRAEAMLPIGSLPSGRYVLKAEVLADGRKIGESTARVSK